MNYIIIIHYLVTINTFKRMIVLYF